MSASKLKFYTYYDRPASPSLECKSASLCRQEFAAEADINNIMSKYAAGLASIPAGDRTPMFGDFSDLGDYQSNMQRMIDAHEQFMQLPSKIREKFRNDPGELLEFLADESNRDEAVKIGLINPKPEKPGEGEEPAERSSPEAGKAT